MDPEATLKTVDPEPMSSPASKPFLATVASAPPVLSASVTPYHPGLDSQLTERPASTADLPKTNSFPRANDFPPRANDFPVRANDFPRPDDFPPRSNDYYRPAEFVRPMQAQTPLAQPLPLDIRGVKSNCQHNMRALMRLLRQRQSFGMVASAVDLEWQIRNQTGILLGELRTLEGEVRHLAKQAKGHRWRKWLLGGFIASFIPAVRKLFRRGSDVESRSTSNNTEYAFKRAKGLIDRIKATAVGISHFASVAFFVFAVLYVFQNEVTLRVARTVQKRIKKLTKRIEFGEEVDERDLKLLEGWRWRVMLWS